MNERFLKRIEAWIPDEYDAFLQSLETPVLKGVRINPKKIDPAQLAKTLGLEHASPFYPYLYVADRSGLDPYHLCGAFYLQEPSASSVVPLLDVQKDDFVLDLCAAPGSKSTQILDALEDGYLVSNEIHPKRAQALLSNLERMGAMNFALTNSDPHPLCAQFPLCFDKILVDAPCSGEGMIKKHEEARLQWSEELVLQCQARQREILKEAISALKGGGRLVYSTCTYSIEENEQNVAWLLKRFPEMKQVDIDVEFGRPGFSIEGMDASKVRRIFPMDGGEGQFMAVFEKEGDAQGEPKEIRDTKKDREVEKFFQENLQIDPLHILVKNDKIFGMDHPFLDFGKVKVLRQGVLMGEIKKNRIEPAHAFYMVSQWKDLYKKKVDLDLEEMDRFMHGEMIQKPSPKGYVGVCYEGIPFGFGKSDGKRINNKLPKGLRLLLNSHVRKEEHGN